MEDIFLPMTMMDSDLEDLESVYSAHFGRTPGSTPFASQTTELSDGGSDSDIDDTDNANLNDRARQFLETVQTANDEANNIHVIHEDDPDMDKINTFLRDGCGCHINCHKKLEDHAIYTHIMNVREMDKADKEMYLMGTLVQDRSGESTQRGKKRLRASHQYMCFGQKVCKTTFMLVFDIGKHALHNITTHMSINGPVPRTHANTGKKPSNALTFEDVSAVVHFISNYADECGLPQPAAPRGRDNVPPIYLPSDTMKTKLHNSYSDSVREENAEKRTVKYSTFCQIWKECLGHIKIAQPRDDVCATCEKMRKAIVDAIGEEEKLLSTTNFREHIISAQKERDAYNQCIRQAKLSHSAGNEDIQPRNVHYTFDFSQNVCLPHHARQMGPVYFTSTRKIQMFGFRIDGIPKQLNFLIDENETIGGDGTSTHGPDAVISMIDWAMNTHGQGERICSIHADNCPGQNKNRFVIGYFMWRVMTGKHDRIEYMMQVPGHSRCLVDGAFGNIKQLYRRTDCDSIDHIEDVVNRSSVVNCAIRYPSWQWKGWKAFLDPIVRSLPGIRKFQYFLISGDEPGIVKAKKTFDAHEVVTYNILKHEQFRFGPNDQPALIPAHGLSRQRQQYLYRVVRPFVRSAFQDTTCPAPDI